MVHKFYIEPNTDAENAGSALIETQKENGNEKTVLLGVRRFIEISGEISGKTVSDLKERLVSHYTEKISGRKSSAGKSYTVMQKDGVPDERIEEIRSVIGLVEPEADVKIRLGKEYVFPIDYENCEEYLEKFINPLFEIMEGTACEKETADLSLDPITGFIDAKYGELQEIRKNLMLEMDMDDLMCVQNYFLSESRNPTYLEIKIIDGFFSENFRHTTFEIVLDDVLCDDPAIKSAWDSFRLANPDKKKLSDIAGAAGDYNDEDVIKATDKLTGVRIHSKGNEKPVLIVKNEAMLQNSEWDDDVASCSLGGSVRDLLCGLGYSYDSFRLSGRSTSKIGEEAITNAVSSSSSSLEYSAKLGIPFSGSKKIESDVFEGRRFDLCTVLAVSDENKLEKMKGKCPEKGDIVCILGARTGRDGSVCFKGSVKTDEREYKIGSECPVGQPGILASLERLYTHPGFENIPVALNDIGSGGLICALGEITCGVTVFADSIPLAYEGVTLTERLISETEERMIIFLKPEDYPELSALCKEENVECTEIAIVNGEERLIIANHGMPKEEKAEEVKKTSGKKNSKKNTEDEVKDEYITLVSISSDFLENGSVDKHFSAKIEKPLQFDKPEEYETALPERKKRTPIQRLFGGLKMDYFGAVNKVLEEVFKETADKNTEAALGKISYRSKEFSNENGKLCSALSYAVQPELCKKDPYRASYLTVIEAIMKLYVSGFAESKKYLTLHEYFQSHEHNSKRLGVPVAMMLGAYKAKSNFGIPVLGGRCSMSKSDRSESNCAFAAFALCVGNQSASITKDFKRAGNTVILLRPETDVKEGLPVFESEKRIFEYIRTLSSEGKIKSASSVNGISAARAVAEICRISGKGFVFRKECTPEDIFDACYGGAIIEVKDYTDPPKGSVILGNIVNENALTLDSEKVEIPTFKKPEKTNDVTPETKFLYLKPCTESYGTEKTVRSGEVNVLIPVTRYSVSVFKVAGMFEKEKAKVRIYPIDGKTIDGFREALRETDILYIPDSAGHRLFMTSVISMPEVKSELELFTERGGLIYGVGNGFEALFESGLLGLDKNKLGFAENPQNEYENTPAKITVASVVSPFLHKAATGDEYDTLITGKHLRLCGSAEYMKELARSGRIATQFKENKLGTVVSVDSVCSENGRVFGQISDPARPVCEKDKKALSILPVISSAVGYFAK